MPLSDFQKLWEKGIILNKSVMFDVTCPSRKNRDPFHGKKKDIEDM